MSRRKWCPCLLLTGLVVVSAVPPSTAQTVRSADEGTGEPDVPSREALEQQGATVGQIKIRVLDVFDTDKPEENNWFFRTANRLHIGTRKGVIRSQLLFETGDPFSGRLLDESERVLRASGYLHFAEIRPVRFHGGVVDIDVTVRNVWTLTVAAGVSRSGGENRENFELEDSNLFGTGKEATLRWRSDLDRDSFLMRYRDPLLAGTRARLDVSYSNNSDGQERRLDVVRPFFALESRWAAGALTQAQRQIDQVYAGGEIVDRFRHQLDRVEVFGGWSAGLRQGRAQRLTTGFTFEHHRFKPDEHFLGPTILPEDRKLAYPWIGFERVGDAFVEEQDLDQIARVEDLRLGTNLSARLGLSSPALSGDRTRLIFESRLSRGYRPGDRHLLLLNTFVSGRYGTAGFENLWAGGNVRYYLRNLGRHQFVALAGLDLAGNLDRENQLLLGGDNGLRGYPVRFQDGDRRFLLTLEQRFYHPRQFFRLVYAGAAVFLDTGNAWDGDQPGGGLLTDVGLGLRLSPSRSGRDTIVHLDVAFPLDGDGSIDSVQWLVTTKDSF